jgi:hypothetical protein
MLCRFFTVFKKKTLTYSSKTATEVLLDCHHALQVRYLNPKPPKLAYIHTYIHMFHIHTHTNTHTHTHTHTHTLTYHAIDACLQKATNLQSMVTVQKDLLVILEA